jgi:hypothetical protein
MAGGREMHVTRPGSAETMLDPSSGSDTGDLGCRGQSRMAVVLEARARIMGAERSE